MKLNEVINQLNIDLDFCAISPNGGSFRLRAMDVAPMEFLVLAEEDFAKGGMAASLNCITNAKRAIVSQMDQILMSFGYKSLAWNIPKKIEILKKLGLLLPPILRKVSKTRNLLEHEYKKPNQDDIESALDIASLYVWGMSSLFNCFGDEVRIAYDKTYDKTKDKHEKYIDLALLRENDRVYYCGYGYDESTKNEKEEKKVYKIEIENSDPLFFPLVRIAIAFDTHYRINESILAFDEAYKNII